MKLTSEQRLNDLLAALPRAAPMRGDPWSAIEVRITPPPRGASARTVLAGVAAGIAIGWGWFAARPNLGPAAVLAPAFETGRLQAVRARQAEAFRSRLPLLDGKTRARVERDLALIRAAEADLKDAAAASPDSPVLLRLYEGTTRQEFELYDVVLRTTESTPMRNAL